MRRSWIDRPAVYRKVIFSVIAILLSGALLFGGSQSPIGSDLIYMVQAVYYTGAALVFILSLLPWVWPERD